MPYYALLLKKPLFTLFCQVENYKKTLLSTRLSIYERNIFMLTGVYLQKKKDQTPLYRASISLLGKRISLGSFETEQRAHDAYLEAHSLFSSEQSTTVLLEQYSSEQQILPFTKWVVLLNYRDNKIYIKTPIYLEKKFFTYYYSKEFHLKFDVERCVWELEKAETELWKAPPDQLLEAVSRVLTLENPKWEGTATELVALLDGVEIAANVITRKLNVKADELYNKYHIRFASDHPHGQRRIILQLAEEE